MLELKILIRKLRGYPENSFAYPTNKDAKDLHWDLFGDGNVKPADGLLIVDLQGNEQGFIETGGKEGVLDK